MLLTLILEPPLLTAQLLYHRQYLMKESWEKACLKSLSPFIREGSLSQKPEGGLLLLSHWPEQSHMPTPTQSITAEGSRNTYNYL